MNYIGIDLGGTNIKGALVSAKGEILKEHSIPTRVDLGPEAVAGRIGQVSRSSLPARTPSAAWASAAPARWTTRAASYALRRT